MIGKLVSFAITLVGLAAFAYVYFCVPLGELTLHEHTRRIIATEAAQDLGREAKEAAARVKDAAERGVGHEVDEHTSDDQDAQARGR
ncbi:MAG: hypothetical protein R3A78_01795 [Polyangiales bacterium]